MNHESQLITPALNRRNFNSIYIDLEVSKYIMLDDILNLSHIIQKRLLTAKLAQLLSFDQAQFYQQFPCHKEGSVASLYNLKT